MKARRPKLNDTQEELPAAFLRFGYYCDSLWDKTTLTNEQKADLIRNAALRLLNGEEFAEENAPNAGGRLTAQTLESDARKLMGRPAINVVARRMSREELLAAKSRLTEAVSDVS